MRPQWAREQSPSSKSPGLLQPLPFTEPLHSQEGAGGTGRRSRPAWGVFYPYTGVEYISVQNLTPSQVGEYEWLPPAPHCLGGILGQVHQWETGHWDESEKSFHREVTLVTPFWGFRPSQLIYTLNVSSPSVAENTRLSPKDLI